MSSHIERWPPPKDPVAFEALCFDLWSDIWGEGSQAKLHGRRGQAQAGVDVYGKSDGQWVGVQCKQKDERLWSTVTESELAAEMKAAREFEPTLSRFILATTAVRDTKLQRKARELSDENAQRGLFSVEVLAWEDIWHALYLRPDLLSRIARKYWPALQSLPPRPPTIASLAEECRAYLEFIAPQCQRLPLIGLDPNGKDNPMTLDAVYTALDTTKLVNQEKATPLSALHAVLRHPCVVLKGDPGAGKSTFLSYLALCLANHLLDPSKGWLDKLAGWPAATPLLPITVVLRDFVRQQPRDLPEPSPRCLVDHVGKSLAADVLNRCLPALETALDLGHAIVFLDGLDEVPTESQREFARACALRFAERFHHCRVVLTCRTLPYANLLKKEAEAPTAGGLRLADVPAFEVAPFSDEQIQSFITAWCTAHTPKPFTREMAAERRDSLAQAVRRPELRRLAGNPMLLTDMALLHTHRGRLPDDRARLYKEVIELLLLRWDEARQDSRLQDLLREAYRDENDLLRKLGEIAFTVHGRSRDLSRDKAGDIPQHELIYALRELHPKQSLDWAERVVATIQERAGLLIANGETIFRFPHRSFQEYLAGLHLVKDRATWNKINDLLDKSGYWREVVKWAAGRIAHVDDAVDEKGLNLLRKICPEDTPGAPVAWHRVWLAGECLLEMSLAKVEQFADEGGPALVQSIRRRLEALVSEGALAPVERAQAGMALGRIRDERPGVGLQMRTGRADLPDFAWSSRIEPEPFTMGSKDKDTTWQDEKPQFTCTSLSGPYRISLHPVTVAQYEAFTKAGGYTAVARHWWTDAGWEWKEKNQIAGPADDAPAFQTPNHPRVGVSWYEAVAFCNWVNQAGKGTDFGLPDDTWRIRLPTEAEWERAARHTVKARRHANIAETGIGHTSPVGMFPSGRAKCGALDFAGNVWEWCLTIYRSSYHEFDQRADQGVVSLGSRVVRGGSWNDPKHRERSPVRDGRGPVARYRFLGFRLVASPFVYE